ncbi:beta-lactamase regulating signal transducer with metallopeptidase domain [Gelidibacter sediminis]|uniref:Beta-lactamase regulating signal transducer with metallopeptidase domain n=1 Tax=Gelidibacter sediminis TaxID=1608710 RepID=A0A4R7Q676_9FLAO|nr:M56 family metallopeptidase [Gelidibacter sediminis]TDU43087.1 beta-lactamase regulating signal transducer with metallopeptidase domain [Gelidibacter sediminis]
MQLYLLKSAACLAIFMVFYKYVLEKENMHIFKRYYLLGALVLAFTIPLVTFTQTIEVITSPRINEATVRYVENTPQIEQTDYLALILWSIYGLGVMLFGTKFLRNLYQIIFKIYLNPKKKSNHIVHVLLSDMITPHTFFKYIFLNKQKFENEEIPQEVFWHEEAHAIQKHSVDVLFVEFLQVIFWFNPIIYFTKHSIKMNHEFLADQAVLNKGVSAANYQHILLAFSSNATAPIGMANAINYSSIRLKVFGKQIALFNAFGQVKKRFTVMKTHTTKQRVCLKCLVLLPLLALTLYGFSEKKEIVKEIYLQETSQETLQKKATPEEVAEYNKLAKHYNNQSDDHRVIMLKDMTRIKVLYDKMSDEQKASAEPLPNFPPPPPPPAPPIANQAMRLPPPPPLPPNPTAKQIKAHEKAVEKSVEKHMEQRQYTYKHKTEDGKNVDVLVIMDTPDHLPLPPPPPASPLVHVKKLAKKNALFFYEGKSITSEEAIKIMEKDGSLNISIKELKPERPKVYITKEPITID